MSYYMGDYYSGDPGFWSSVWGLTKRAAGLMIPGGGLAAQVAERAAKPLSVVEKVRAIGGRAVSAGKGAIIKHPVLSAAGAAGALGAMGAGVEHMVDVATMGGAHVRGMHPCKGLRPGHKPHPCKTGAMVPNRRMNPFNPRAARRAARRLHSLVRHYRKYIGFVSAKKPKGRPFIKRRKK